MKLICTRCNNVKEVNENLDTGNTIYCLCRKCLIKMGKKLRTKRAMRSRKNFFHL